MAKYKALKAGSIDRYKDTLLKSELEIDIQDIMSSEQEKSDNQDAFITDEDMNELNEFWDEKETLVLQGESNDKKTVDQRLEEYLRRNAQHLSYHVQQYIKRSRDNELSANEKISSLGLLTYERKQFVESLKKMQNAFGVQLRQVRFIARIKAEQIIKSAFERINRLLNKEVSCLFEQFAKQSIEFEKTKRENQRMTQIMNE